MICYIALVVPVIIVLLVDGGGGSSSNNSSGHNHSVNDGSNISSNAIDVTIIGINNRNINTQ